MPLSIAINFNGNCREAVNFYAGVFGSEPLRLMTYGEGDASFDQNFQVTEAMRDKIMFAYLDIAGALVEFSDMPDGFDFERGNSMSPVLVYARWADAQKAFDGLCAGGQVFVPFANIPGQGWYGMLADRFGIVWIFRASAK